MIIEKQRIDHRERMHAWVNTLSKNPCCFMIIKMTRV